MSLQGWVVVIDGFSVAAKSRLRTLLAAEGAQYAYSISPKVTHLLLREGESLSAYKEQQLKSWNITIINELPEGLQRDVAELDVFNSPLLLTEPEAVTATIASEHPKENITGILKSSPQKKHATKPQPSRMTATTKSKTSPTQTALKEEGQRPKNASVVIDLPPPPAPRAVKSQKRPQTTTQVAATTTTTKTTSEATYTPTTRRSIRVFVSSTFADMQAEREHLVTVVFPQIRASCAERHIDFGFVDMRWGITDEMTASGETIVACLKEIDACRPYFIGLLGNRYGWCDPQRTDNRFQLSIHKAVEAGFEWVQRFADRSVTELEMLYGALMPSLAPPAALPFQPLFCIRTSDPLPDASPEASKLADLKNRVMGAFPCLEYTSVAQMGEALRVQLLDAIQKRFPPSSDPSAAEMEDEAHEKCAFDHEQAYVSLPDSQWHHLEQRIIDELGSAGATPIVLSGPSGSGKSALIAHLLFKLRSLRPKDKIVAHFVGCTDSSSDFTFLMRRIVAQLAGHFGAPTELPEEAEAVGDAFRQWLNGLSVGGAARKRAVLLLDGLDHLQALPGAADLHWLPFTMPANVTLIVTTAPGSCLSILEARQRDWTHIEMVTLNADERGAMVEKTLAKVGKKLDAQHVGQLKADLSRSPLYLRVVLSELCSIGVYDTLAQHVRQYLKSTTVAKLFEQVLSRWLSHYGVVLRSVLVAIACTRHGTAEFEILKALNIPHPVWSSFYGAVKDFLPVKGSLITFIHPELRAAVLSLYGNELRTVRLQLCKYFEDDPALTARKTLELPYLLEQCEEKNRLKTFFADLRVFSYLFEPDETRYEFIRQWRFIGDGEVFPAVAVYKTALKQLGQPQNNEQAESFSRLYFLVGDFFRETSQNEASMEIFKQALTMQEGLMLSASSGSIDDQRRVAKLQVETLDGLCSMAKRLEFYDEGVQYGERAASLAEQYLGRYSYHLIDVYSDLAAVLGKMNRLGEAEAAARKAVLVATQKGDFHYDAAMAYHHLAIILKKQKRYEEAEQYYVNAIEIRMRALGPTHLLTSHSRTNLANFYNKTHRYDEAEALHREAMKVVLETFGHTSPDYAQCMFNLANCLLTRTENTWKIGDDASRLEEAKTLLKSAEEISERVYGHEHELCRNIRIVQRGIKTMELQIDKTHHPEKYLAQPPPNVETRPDIDMDFERACDMDFDEAPDLDQDMGFSLFM